MARPSPREVIAMAAPKKKTETTAKKAAAAKPVRKTPAASKPPAAPKVKKPTSKSATARASRQLLDGKGLAAAVEQLVQSIYRDFPSPVGLVLLGIRTRGVFIAERLKTRLEEKYGVPVGLGIVDITFYRDDLSRLGPDPMVKGSEMPFNLDGANVILVDDVLYTGRTVRAAMDEICDFGRPALIRLACLVDRGLREYPIHADYCGLTVATRPEEVIHVHLSEVDDEDQVLLLEKE
jgi:pyrimidine operon attenuation protein/uracil phosphoribosyltransferase